MDNRFKELVKRLIAPGTPYFSASEFHELHDYVMESQKKRKPEVRKLLRVIIEFDTEKAIYIGRQTVLIEMSELKKKIPVMIRGKKVKSISVEIVNMNKKLPGKTDK
jgi:hypothetical protein